MDPEVASCCFDLLPDELLSSILSKLTPQDLIHNVKLVSKRFYGLVRSSSVWRELDFDATDLNAEDTLQLLHKLSILRSLKIVITDDLLTAVVYEMGKPLSIDDILGRISMKAFNVRIFLSLGNASTCFMKHAFCPMKGLLHLTAHCSDDVFYSQNSFVSSIIQHSSDTLRSVHVTVNENNFLFKDEMEGLELCSKLQKVRIPILAVSALNGLDHVWNVTLDVNSEDDNCFDDFQSKVLTCIPMSNVKFLSLDSNSCRDLDLSDILINCELIFPNVTSLSLKGMTWGRRGLLSLASGFRHLSSLCINDCASFDMSVLEILIRTLGEIRDIKGTVNTRTTDVPLAKIVLSVASQKFINVQSLFFYDFISRAYIWGLSGL